MEHLLYMPDDMQWGIDYFKDGLREDIVCLGAPIGSGSLEFVVISKLYSLYMHMVFQKKGIKIPFYEVSMKDMGIDLGKYAKETYYQCDDLNSDIMLEVMDEYVRYCIGMMDTLCTFGWRKSEKLTIDDEYIEKTSRDAHNAILGAYRDYFDVVLEEVQINSYKEYDVYIYVNEDLGLFEKYCLDHEVDTELKTTIHFYLSLLRKAFGVENCVDCNQEYGHEMIFALDSTERDSIPCEYNLLFPIYAYNLKVLLDKAFSMYPIKKGDLESEQVAGTDRNSRGTYDGTENGAYRH